MHASARSDCPIDIIYIDWHQEVNPETGKKEKVLDRFDIDVQRCMFCGLCEEGCPTEPKSIWLTTKTYELASYDRWHEPLRRHGRAAGLEGPAGLHRRGDRLRTLVERRGRSSSTSSPRWRAGRRGRRGRRCATRCTARSRCWRRFLAVAALFLLRHAEFLAIVQIFVYGGGIMVLFLFVIMLVNLHQLRETAALPRPVAGRRRSWCWRWRRFFVYPARRRRLRSRRSPTRTSSSTVDGEALGNSQAVAWSLYRDYLLPFEIASVFLLVAMIGAVVLGQATVTEVTGMLEVTTHPLPGPRASCCSRSALLGIADRAAT